MARDQKVFDDFNSRWTTGNQPKIYDGQDIDSQSMLEVADAFRQIMSQPIQLAAIPGLEEIAALESRMFPDTEGFIAEQSWQGNPRLLADKAAELSRQGRFDEMQELRMLYWRLSLANLGTTSPDTIIALSSIAKGYYFQDQFVQSLRAFQEVVRLRTAIFGRDHRDTAMAIAGVGQSLEGLGRYSEALVFHQQAATTLEKSISDRHPDTADSYVDLGCTLQSLGRLKEAESYFMRALAIRIEHFGLDDLLTAEIQANLGTVLLDLNRAQEAVALFHAALETVQDFCRSDHPTVRWVTTLLGNAYLISGEYEKAFYRYQQAESDEPQRSHSGYLQSLSLQINMETARMAIDAANRTQVDYERWAANAESDLGEEHPVSVQLRAIASSYDSDRPQILRLLTTSFDQHVYQFAI